MHNRKLAVECFVVSVSIVYWVAVVFEMSVNIIIAFPRCQIMGLNSPTEELTMESCPRCLSVTLMSGRAWDARLESIVQLLWSGHRSLPVEHRWVTTLTPSSPNKLHPADWHASSPRPWSWPSATAALPTSPLLSRDLCHDQKLMKWRVHRTRLVVCCCQVEDKWCRRWSRHWNKCTSLALIAHRSICLLGASEAYRPTCVRMSLDLRSCYRACTSYSGWPANEREHVFCYVNPIQTDVVDIYFINFFRKEGKLKSWPAATNESIAWRRNRCREHKPATSSCRSY